MHGKAGTVCGQIVQQADVMATMADILGVTLPDNAGEDSVSFLPLLRGDDPGETKNLAAAIPGKVTEMKARLEKIITEGRSTPGAKLPNDVKVLSHPRA
jgi:arylsulfatase A